MSTAKAMAARTGAIASVFGVVGDVLSICAVSSMAFILLSDPDARNQVRPRMLIMLAVIDLMYSAASLALDIAFFVDPAVGGVDFFIFPLYAQIVLFLQQLFGLSAYFWTALIGSQ
jgi:hypothetical protein